MRKASKLFHFLSVVLLMLAFDVSAAFAQNRTIKGNVTDANGEPLIGATVNVKGNSTLGTLTDLDGNFSLSIPNQRGVVLVVSYVGYEPKEIDVAGRTVINVSLSDDTQVLRVMASRRKPRSWVLSPRPRVRRCNVPLGSATSAQPSQVTSLVW